MSRILIIEDDEAIALLEKDYLEINDFEVSICSDGVKGIEEAFASDFDLILLDLMLPKMDGFSVCKKLRERLDIPILMVTAKQEQCNEIRGLGLGADDYIMKPFEPSVLVARVKANIAQYKRSHKEETGESSKILSKGPFLLQLNTRRAFMADTELILKNKEYEILLFFLNHMDMVLSKDVLYEHIWGTDSLGDTATVAVHINRLRDKMTRIDADHTYIQTVWGVGYRFSL